MSASTSRASSFRHDRRNFTSEDGIKVRRLNAGTLVAANRQPDISNQLFLTNTVEFDTNKEPSLLLFCAERNEADVVFDPDNDEVLFAMHADPYNFSNTELLLHYEALTSRANYECKPHVNQELVQAQAALELGVDTSSMLFLVYKRDLAIKSPVKLRRMTPFENDYNGLKRDKTPSVQLLLFGAESFDPMSRVTIVWHRPAHRGSTFGLIGVTVNELFV